MTDSRGCEASEQAAGQQRFSPFRCSFLCMRCAGRGRTACTAVRRCCVNVDGPCLRASIARSASASAHCPCSLSPGRPPASRTSLNASREPPRALNPARRRQHRGRRATPPIMRWREGDLVDQKTLEEKQAAVIHCLVHRRVVPCRTWLRFARATASRLQRRHSSARSCPAAEDHKGRVSEREGGGSNERSTQASGAGFSHRMRWPPLSSATRATRTHAHTHTHRAHRLLRAPLG